MPGTSLASKVVWKVNGFRPIGGKQYKLYDTASVLQWDYSILLEGQHNRSFAVKTFPWSCIAQAICLWWSKSGKWNIISRYNCVFIYIHITYQHSCSVSTCLLDNFLRHLCWQAMAKPRNKSFLTWHFTSLVI